MAESILSISLTGDQNILKGLKTGSAFASQEVAKALNKAANDVLQDAVSKAPHKSGRLWGSLHTGNPDSATSSATAMNMKAVVGTKLAYARAQEFGTQGMVIHSHSKSGKQFSYVGNIKPKHFLTQAKSDVKPKLTQYLQLAAQRIVSYMANGS